MTPAVGSEMGDPCEGLGSAVEEGSNRTGPGTAVGETLIHRREALVPPPWVTAPLLLLPTTTTTTPSPKRSPSHAFCQHLQKGITLTFAPTICRKASLIQILSQCVAGLNGVTVHRLELLGFPEILTNPEEVGERVANPRLRRWGDPPKLPEEVFDFASPPSPSAERNLSDRETPPGLFF
jgi:hypothetical protein